MKKIIPILLSVVSALSFAGCGKEKTPANTSSGGITTNATWEEVKGSATPITIYVDESNVYGSYIAGGEESYVKEQIEKKFYEDTGNAINLKIMYETHETFTSSFGGVMSTGQWDAAVSYLGQAGLEETVLNQDVVMNVKDLMMSYGSNIKKAVDKQAMYATTMLTGEVIGIPSVMKTSTKGVLVREDMMNEVGYTSKKGGELKYCQTINDFNDMLAKMKAQYDPNGTGTFTPIIGNSYDVEFMLLAGVCDTAGYQYRSVNYNTDGSVKEVVPGWISEGYDKMLSIMYTWQKSKLWEADHATIPDQTRITNFVNGKAAIYCADPTISNLISVARQVKASDPDAELAILNPIDAVDESGAAVEGSGAYVASSRTTDCMVINKKSTKAELLIKYLDWMYSDKANYELCAYGVEGEHWVATRDGFYKYPDAMADRYFKNPPYSGVFALLHNDEFAYRMYDAYTEQELAWIEQIENAKCITNPTDGMLLYDMPQTVSANFTLAEGEIYTNCATKAWSGTTDPAVSYAGAVAKYRTQAGDYITWLTQQYKLYIEMRAE